MAANTVLVTKLVGNAWVRGTDGNLTALREGMQIPADAQVITASGSTLELQADGQPPLIVGENQNVTFTADLLNPPLPQEAAIAKPAPSEIDQIIAAINSGKDPFADLDATAATLSGGSEGGSTFVRLSSILELTSPLGLAYPRPGSLPVEEPRLNGAQLSEDDEPGSATVTPSTGTGDDDAGKVYERGLLNGDATKTTNGSVTVSATDGIKDVTIGGATHTVGDWVGKSVTTADGSTLTVTSVTTQPDGSVTLNYSYTLNTAQTNDQAGNNTSVTDTIGVAVTG
ncbi:MAG: retention module-containing protein, partial [Comamonas sp.]